MMNLPTPKLCEHVRGSTDQDLASILEWLQRQNEAQEVTFWVNRQVIERCHLGGDLLVYECPVTADPIAFQLGGLLRPGILEVRHDHRGKGVGSALALHCMAKAAEADEDILCIQCEPPSSIPFWEKMGFTLLGGDDGAASAFRLLPRVLLPTSGLPQDVVLRWYPESVRWTPDEEPLQEDRLVATLQEGVVHLPQRVLFASVRCRGDVVLRVTVEGLDWYFDKAKYEAAEQLGVLRNWNGFRVDQVARPG